MTDTATAKSTVHMVIIFLGVYALIGLLGVLWLTDQGSSEGQIAVIVALAGPPAGALAGILGNTRSPAAPAPPVEDV